MAMSDDILEELDESSHEEMPAGMERRLVLRLLAYWRDLVDYMYEDEENEDVEVRLFPALSEINRREIREFWPNCFVLEFGAGDQAVFREAGKEYSGHYPSRLKGVPVSELLPGTLAAESTSHLAEVLVKGVPITRGGEFTDADGNQVLYRSIILPLSEDGENIDGFIGAANCRVVAKE